MATDFPLLDQAALAAVNKLNRIFQRQDMAIEALIKIAHHRRQGGGFPATGGARDQDKPALLIEQLR